MSDWTLSIVVPVYNEALRLPKLFAVLDAEAEQQARAAGLELVELIVVDDGSTDETPELLAAHARSDARVRLIRLERNRGKGAAVRAGVLSAVSTHVLMMDADLSTPLSEIDALMAALDDGNDVAIGSRGLPLSRIQIHQPLHRELMGKCFNILLRVLTGLPYRDTQCGFKLFRLETTRLLFELQQIDGFAFDVELCLNASRLGVRVAEVPVVWADNADTRVHLVRASTRMALDLLRIRRLAQRPLPSPASSTEIAGVQDCPPTNPTNE